MLHASSRKLAILFVEHAKVMTEHLVLLGSCVREELCEE